jgi:hypothetical protein
MVVSRRRLHRCDDRVKWLRGRFDPETGVRFVVEEERILR